MEPIELLTTGVAVGGAGIARDEDGRVVFVEGALGGERVVADIVESRKSFRRARLVQVIEPSADRIEPVCPEVANGCGGCDLPYATTSGQRATKAAMVSDSLRRVGRIDDHPDIDPGPDLAGAGFRTTVRAGVSGGRAGLRRRHSHDLVDVSSCRVAHPLVEELLVDGRFGGNDEVTIRVGARTGERMVVADRPDDVSVPPGVVVVGRHGGAMAEPSGTRRGADHLHEEVAGSRFRISPRSFFQTRADGAEALVEVVGDLVEATGPTERTLVDLCCGVGLFAATLGASFGHVVAVESNRSAIADARVNLAGLEAPVDIVPSTFERWRPRSADVVIADPSRAGLGRAGVERVAATGAPTVVLVSCDAGSLGRDAGLMVSHGYRLASVTLVDLFPDTSHVEVVTSYRRSE